jgi:hypothetical protein
MLFGPASTCRVMPMDPFLLIYGALAKASTTVLIAAADGA